MLRNALWKRKRNRPEVSEYSRFSHTHYFSEIARISSSNRWRLPQGSICRAASVLTEQQNTLGRALPTQSRAMCVPRGLQSEIWNKYTKELSPSIKNKQPKTNTSRLFLKSPSHLAMNNRVLKSLSSLWAVFRHKVFSYSRRSLSSCLILL